MLAVKIVATVLLSLLALAILAGACKEGRYHKVAALFEAVVVISLFAIWG